MRPEEKFTIGMRVKLSARGREAFKFKRGLTAIVVGFPSDNDSGVKVLRESIKARQEFHETFWEPIWRHSDNCPSLCDENGELVNGSRDWGCNCGAEKRA